MHDEPSRKSYARLVRAFVAESGRMACRPQPWEERIPSDERSRYLADSQRLLDLLPGPAANAEPND
jgi:hypothetical protein